MRSRFSIVLVGMLLAAPPSLAGDGVVALQTAAPSCRNKSSNIYVNCKNGTVTDNRTGLVWLKNANCIGSAGGGTGTPLGRVDWYTAMEFVAGLSDKPAMSVAASDDCGLSDGSSPGDWRLPSVEEWEGMIADALGQGGDPDCAASPPTITNDSGLGCWVSGPSSFTGVVASFYWSASTRGTFPSAAWGMGLVFGAAGNDFKTGSYYVWPVRGGQ